MIIIHFYRLVQFHTWICFFTRLSVRVSDSGHPAMYPIIVFKNKPGHKIYRCTSVFSTQHHALLHNPTLLHTMTYFAPDCHPRKIYRCMSACSTINHRILHNPTILYTKTFFTPACHPRQKIPSEKNCHTLHWYTHARLTCHRSL